MHTRAHPISEDTSVILHNVELNSAPLRAGDIKGAREPKRLHAPEVIG